MSERRRSAPAERMPDSVFEDLYTRYADDVLRVSYFYLADRQKA